MMSATNKHWLTPFSCDAPIKRYSCNYCGFSTDLLVTLKRHTETHTFIKQEELAPIIQHYECKYCSFSTCFALNLYKHVFRDCAGPQNPARRKVDLLPDHNYSKDPRRGSKRFVYKELLKRMFTCPECGYKTDIEASFKNHTAAHLHDQIQWLRCDSCDFKTTLKSLLEQHTSTVHKNRCEKTVKSYGRNPQRHKDVKPDVGAPEIEWFTCRITTDKPEFLRRAASRIKCDECGHVVRQLADLKRHKLIRHFREGAVQWFNCKECDYKANMVTDLRRHVLEEHAKGQWFQCGECEFKTMVRGELGRHKGRGHSVN